jgi:hypothetical protein
LEPPPSRPEAATDEAVADFFVEEMEAAPAEDPGPGAPPAASPTALHESLQDAIESVDDSYAIPGFSAASAEPEAEPRDDAFFIQEPAPLQPGPIDTGTAAGAAGLDDPAAFFVDDTTAAPAGTSAAEDQGEPVSADAFAAEDLFFDASADAPPLAAELSEPDLPPLPPLPPLAVDPPPPPPAPVAAAPPSPPARVAVPPAQAVRPEPHRVESPPTPRRAAPAPADAAGAEPRRPPAASPRPVRTARAAPRAPSPIVRYAAIGAGGLALLLAVGFFAVRALKVARVDTMTPNRVHVGQGVTLTGKNFSSVPIENTVMFGEHRATVIRADAGRLEVEVPEMPTKAGEDIKVPVTVSVGGRGAAAVEIAVYQAPRLHGISPDVAMPGEEVSLAGTGWGPGATVRFGALPAEVLEITPTSIRARVPAIAGGPGAAAPVVVALGADESNAGPFFVGHIPLVTGAEPRSAMPGDPVVVSGRGFQMSPSANQVTLGGAPALVFSSSDTELTMVVPRVPPGDRTVEVRVPGSEFSGQVSLAVGVSPDPAGFRFIAEPFTAVPGRDHAVVATDLGPLFVLAASGGRSAAQRAHEAAQRFNEAALVLRTQGEAQIELRGIDSDPSLGITGQAGPLVEVTAEDARAYEEDWTNLKGRGGAVTRSRLAVWWSAVARDLVLLLVRGQRPRHAAAIAPEGRVLGDLYQAAQRTVRFGVPRQVLVDAKPATREALRLIAFRVPPTVVGAASSIAGSPGASAPGATPLKLDGVWTGTEDEGSTRRYITVVFEPGGGDLAYEGAVTINVPLIKVEQPQKATAVFSIQFRGATRYYTGKWDGEKLTGKISTDPSGAPEIATFELRPGR